MPSGRELPSLCVPNSAAHLLEELFLSGRSAAKLPGLVGQLSWSMLCAAVCLVSEEVWAVSLQFELEQ